MDDVSDLIGCNLMLAGHPELHPANRTINPAKKTQHGEVAKVPEHNIKSLEESRNIINPKFSLMFHTLLHTDLHFSIIFMAACMRIGCDISEIVMNAVKENLLKAELALGALQQMAEALEGYKNGESWLGFEYSDILQVAYHHWAEKQLIKE